MKKLIFFIIVVFVFASCEKPSDCVQSTGEIITKDIIVQPFKKIKVYRGIEVVVKVGPEYKVQIAAGENFIDNVVVQQNGDQLIFKDDVSCNWVRAYGTIKIMVTTPTLEEIYSKTEQDISSDGVLTFPVLKVYSLDKAGDGDSGAGTGDFILNVDNDYLHIESNNVSRFFLSGQTNQANLYFSFGDGRIEAKDLIAQTITVYHRGSNDMIVHPIQSITGLLNSTGNLILTNVPPIVDLQELYYGHVIYP